MYFVKYQYYSCFIRSLPAAMQYQTAQSEISKLSHRVCLVRELAISHFGRNVYLPFIPYAHLLHGYNPALYQFVQAECNNYMLVNNPNNLRHFYHITFYYFGEIYFNKKYIFINKRIVIKLINQIVHIFIFEYILIIIFHGNLF